VKKYLIINLGRMGDLVETIPAIVDLKREQPGCHVTLMAAEPFVNLADDIPVLDNVIRVDLRDFMLQDQDSNLLDRYYKLDAFAERLKNTRYDVVLNYTHTKTSAALCHVLNASDTRGVTLDNRGFQVVKNPWLFYFFVSNLNRPYNQFNLVDIYRRSIGGGRTPGGFSYGSNSKGNQEAEELWQKYGIPTDRPTVGFAVGASNHTKRWLTGHFAQLAELLRQSVDAHIVILGSKDDKKIAREIILGKEEFVTDLTAHTSFRGLASVLKRCGVLVSNDTGTMHLAAAVGTPTVSLVMGTALGSETAPYHTKGLVIQSLHHCAPCGYTNLCKDAQCRADIVPEAVAASVDALLSMPDTTSIDFPNNRDFDKIQIYQGGFDPDGLFDLHPLIKRPLDIDSLSDRILRRIWLEFLESPPWDIMDNGGIDRWVDRVVDYCRHYFDLRNIEELASQYHSTDRTQLLKPIPWLDQGMQAAGELIDAANSEPMDIERITVLGDRLAKIDRQLESVGHTQQMLRAFHIYFNLRKASLLSQDLEGQAHETVDIYGGYRLQLLIADRMIEKVLDKLSEAPAAPLKLANSGLAVDSPKPADHAGKEKINWANPDHSQGWEKLRRDLIAGMDLRIPIPDLLSSHIIRGRRLIIAPEKAAWIVTDSLGASALDTLKNSRTIGQCIVDLVEGSGIPAEEAIKSVKALVADITNQGFRADISPVETTLENVPPNLQLFLTRKCNLRCTHCYADAGRALEDEISAESWKQVITEFSGMKAGSVVTFSGGEPLVHPQLPDIAHHAKDFGHKVYLLTNGVAINSVDTAKALAGAVDSVQLSLEGTTAGIHDPVRGRGSFQRAIKGLEYLLAVGFSVEVVFVVLPENVADLRDNLGDFVGRFRNPRLSIALGVVNYTGRAQNTLDDPPESLVGQVVDAYPDAPWLRKGGWISNRIVKGCPLANSIVVDADGRITTCPYLHYHSPYRVGQMPLGKAAAFDRSWHAQTIRQNPKCRDCDLRNFPCGGCMVRPTKCSNQILQRAYYRMVFGR
jgi:radical SAM protein with 4Fe4S-binding SPASM domain